MIEFCVNFEANSLTPSRDNQVPITNRRARRSVGGGAPTRLCPLALLPLFWLSAYHLLPRRTFSVRWYTLLHL